MTGCVSYKACPMGLSETEMCAEHGRECINLLFIKCGVTWDWWLNGDLWRYNCLHEAVTWLVWTQHMDIAKCVKVCEYRQACQWGTQSVTVKCLTRISCSCYFQGFHEATGGPDRIFSGVGRKKHKHQQWLLSFKRAEFGFGVGKQDNVHVKSHRVVFQMHAPTPLWLFWSFRKLLLHSSLTLLCAPLLTSLCYRCTHSGWCVSQCTCKQIDLRRKHVLRHRNHNQSYSER